MKRGLVFLLVVAAPICAFTWQAQLATFGDDSASYLTLAHYFSPSGSAIVSQWAGYHSNFPPIFPMLLALTGGAQSLHVAYALVAVCAAIGTALFYRYAALELGERSGIVVAVLFLLTATAWVSLKGVLSESLFLLASVAALLFHETRIASRRPAVWEWLVLGALLACVALTRAIGIVMAVAYVLHVLVRFAGRQRPSSIAFLPVVPVVVLVGLWQVFKPRAPVDAYGAAMSYVVGSWLEDPAHTFARASNFFFDGWTRSFLADSNAPLVAKVAFAVVGLLAIGGLLMRLRRNRLDAWYVGITLDVVFAWVFSGETTRRLLYPVIPLVILCAAIPVLAMVARLAPRARTIALAATTALPALLCLPVLAMLWERSLDDGPVIAGCPQTYREIADSYWTRDAEDARKLAVLEVTVLCGLQSLEKVTPPDSIVMWVRPEYVALVGRRPAAAYYYAWTADDLAREIRQSNASYLVTTLLDKTDLAGNVRRPTSASGDAMSVPVFSLSDGIFEVRKIR